MGFGKGTVAPKTTPSITRHFHHPRKWAHIPFWWVLTLSPRQPLFWFLSHHSFILLFLELHLNKTTQCVFFCVWLLLFNIIVMGFIRIVEISVVLSFLLVNSILLNKYTTICVSNHWLINIQIVFSFCLLWIKQLKTWLYKPFVCKFSCSWGN